MLFQMQTVAGIVACMVMGMYCNDVASDDWGVKHAKIPMPSLEPLAKTSKHRAAVLEQYLAASTNWKLVKDMFGEYAVFRNQKPTAKKDIWRTPDSIIEDVYIRIRFGPYNETPYWDEVLSARNADLLIEPKDKPTHISLPMVMIDGNLESLLRIKCQSLYIEIGESSADAKRENTIKAVRYCMELLQKINSIPDKDIGAVEKWRKSFPDIKVSNKASVKHELVGWPGDCFLKVSGYANAKERASLILSFELQKAAEAAAANAKPEDSPEDIQESKESLERIASLLDESEVIGWAKGADIYFYFEFEVRIIPQFYQSKPIVKLSYLPLTPRPMNKLPLGGIPISKDMGKYLREKAPRSKMKK